MAEPDPRDDNPSADENFKRASDHLANERTFLAWVRTGVAIVVFGFAIGRFAIAIREFMQVQGHTSRTAGFSVWLGTIAIIAGVLLTLAGSMRYRRTRDLLQAGRFKPAGFVVDLLAIFVALFGLALAGYLVYIGLKM